MIGTDAPLFGRLLTAMVTPFDDSNEIDYKSTEKLIEHLIESGTDTIVVSGTTGESPTLSTEEKLDLLKFTKEKANKKTKIIFGAGTNDTEKSAKLAKKAEKAGADGLLIVAPYYNKPSQEGIAAHIKAINDKTDLPIIVYNIPGRTGINIQPKTMVKIIETCKNVHAIKDSTGDIDQMATLARLCADPFRLYSGDDNLTLPFMSVGACGVISVASHVIGKEIALMMKLFSEGEVREARALHYKYLPLFKGLFIAPNPTCVKYVLSLMGLCKENLRLPLVPLDAEQKLQMRNLLAECEISAMSDKGNLCGTR